MTKYIASFAVFLIVIFVGVTIVRANDSTAQEQIESASGESQEAVLIKKGDLETGAKAKLLQNLAGDYYMGNEYAPVLMIEYASLSCSHCANFHSNVLDDLIVSHVNTGKVKYIYRDFPLNQPALDASKIAMCAPKESYFNFLKVLFKSQENWAFSPNYRDILKNIAKIGGIDAAKFDACLADDEIEGDILQTKKDAIDILGVKSTPTIFINGTEYYGKHQYEKVAKHIDALLTSPSE